MVTNHEMTGEATGCPNLKVDHVSGWLAGWLAVCLVGWLVVWLEGRPGPTVDYPYGPGLSAGWLTVWLGGFSGFKVDYPLWLWLAVCLTGCPGLEVDYPSGSRWAFQFQIGNTGASISKSTISLVLCMSPQFVCLLKLKSVISESRMGNFRL